MTLTSHDIETIHPKQLAGHMLVRNDTHFICKCTSYVSIGMHKSRSLYWMAAILDMSGNRSFAMEGYVGIFNCGQLKISF